MRTRRSTGVEMVDEESGGNVFLACRRSTAGTARWEVNRLARPPIHMQRVINLVALVFVVVCEEDKVKQRAWRAQRWPGRIRGERYGESACAHAGPREAQPMWSRGGSALAWRVCRDVPIREWHERARNVTGGRPSLCVSFRSWPDAAILKLFAPRLRSSSSAAGTSHPRHLQENQEGWQEGYGERPLLRVSSHTPAADPLSALQDVRVTLVLTSGHNVHHTARPQPPNFPPSSSISPPPNEQISVCFRAAAAARLARVVVGTLQSTLQSHIPRSRQLSLDCVLVIWSVLLLLPCL